MFKVSFIMARLNFHDQITAHIPGASELSLGEQEPVIGAILMCINWKENIHIKYFN